ncbi:LamG domain-containing protein [Bacillus infantis]|uniref:LamG domain-containing protein n=1 Tax=Bacillus infantis TaxID=324767 RepID=UPI003CF760A4
MNFDSDYTDSSANHILTTQQGNVSYEQGRVGSAITFGGHTNPGSITVPFHEDFQFENEMTVSYWVKINDPRGYDGNGALVSEGIHNVLHGQRTNTQIFTEYDRVSFYFNSAAGGLHTPEIKEGEWYLVTSVVSKQSVSTFINGELAGSRALASPVNLSTTQGFRIGRQTDNWYPLNGSLDDLRIYNRALNEAEVRALYELGE